MLAIYARAAIRPEIAHAFATVAHAVSIALASAGDVESERDALHATRAHNLERLLDATEASFVHGATALARQADEQRRRGDEQRRRGDELARRVRDAEAESAGRVQRTQRAMLNVIASPARSSRSASPSARAS